MVLEARIEKSVVGDESSVRLGGATRRSELENSSLIVGTVELAKISSLIESRLVVLKSEKESYWWLM